MFANLKKKIESEVGDLSRLTPNLKSITQSEKLTPLSSRHNSISSLASETSYSNKLSSPLNQLENPLQPQFGNNGPGPSKSDGISGNRSDISQQKVKRLFEEKLQTQELDFAWRLNSKDDEISKLQKQVDHLNNLLQSKEFETQQKLVRVQEDMDSLEGFSQQENAKIKHLLLNREEELGQLRAENMNLVLQIAEIQSKCDELYNAMESGKNIEMSNQDKDMCIKNLELELTASKKEVELAELNVQKTKSLVDEKLKELNVQIIGLSQEKEQTMSANLQLQQDLLATRALVELKESELNSTLVSSQKLQEKIDEVTTTLDKKINESQNFEVEKMNLVQQIAEIQFQRDELYNAMESGKNIEMSIQDKDMCIKNLEVELTASKKQVELAELNVQKTKSLLDEKLKELNVQIIGLSQEKEQTMSANLQLQQDLLATRALVELKESEFNSNLVSSQKLQEKIDELTTTLDMKINESQNVKIENMNLVQQIAEIQSKCDELYNALESGKTLEMSIQDKDTYIKNLELELTASKKQVELAELNVQKHKSLVDEKLKELNVQIIGLSQEKEQTMSANLQLQQDLLATRALVELKESELNSNLVSSQKLQEKIDELITTLDRKINESQNVELENSDLVLQISEIQSKCDELEEENKFLKDSVEPEDSETLKRKVVEMEGELLDKNQILKQQSHQLQDLRRSLAKEINKNQAVTELNASATETTQCNGSMSLSSSVTASPPTLPPQETDVNFMYLRSVLFKYLTTTDVQVTQQLTRVVATLLHLSEEETHLLSQSADSRNNWMSHLITKS